MLIYINRDVGKEDYGFSFFEVQIHLILLDDFFRESVIYIFWYAVGL